MPEPMQRPHYFDRQLLGVDDFVLAQTYDLTRRRLHNRLLHTWGITDGLALTFAAGATRASVSAGSALDNLGQEIVLASVTQTPDVSGYAGKAVFVTITYAEADTDARTANGVTGNSRTTETPIIQVSDAAPTNPGAQLIVGRLTVGADGKISASDNGVTPNIRRMAGAIAGALVVDQSQANSGTLLPGLQFGGTASGEGIASKRSPGGNQWGLDFYAGGSTRMSVTNAGNVGIGNGASAARLDVSGSGMWSCCATVPPTLGLSENAAGTGRRAWLQFHNAGEAEAYIRMAGGGPAGSGRDGARRLEIGDSQSVGTSLTVTANITAGGDLAVGNKHALRGNDPWLRLNQDLAFTSGTYVRSVLAPDSLNVGGANGFGNPGPGNAWVAGALTVYGALNYGQLTKLDTQESFSAYVRCGDFNIGISGRRGSPGRALTDLGTTLHVNYGPDWPNLQMNGHLIQSSSRRLKERITDLDADEAMSIVRALQPVRFKFKNMREGDFCLGFIAEDVPEQVGTRDRQAISPMGLIAALARALQVQMQETSELRQALEQVHASKT
jgi:endosialidase-like protein